MTGAWRHPTGDDNVRATARLTKNPAGITQASLADPFDRERLTIDGQIGSSPAVGSAHFCGSREHSQYSRFRPAAGFVAWWVPLHHWRLYLTETSYLTLTLRYTA
jgi:hypothetical protein